MHKRLLGVDPKFLDTIKAKQIEKTKRENLFHVITFQGFRVEYLKILGFIVVLCVSGGILARHCELCNIVEHNTLPELGIM